MRPTREPEAEADEPGVPSDAAEGEATGDSLQPPRGSRPPFSAFARSAASGRRQGFALRARRRRLERGDWDYAWRRVCRVARRARVRWEALRDRAGRRRGHLRAPRRRRARGRRARPRPARLPRPLRREPCRRRRLAPAAGPARPRPRPAQSLTPAAESASRGYVHPALRVCTPRPLALLAYPQVGGLLRATMRTARCTYPARQVYIPSRPASKATRQASLRYISSQTWEAKATGSSGRMPSTSRAWL